MSWFHRDHDRDKLILTAINHWGNQLMSTLDELTTNVATLTAIDTALKTAIDSLIVLVGTLQTGSLTPEQQVALDNANAAIQAISAVDTTETAAVTAVLPPVV